MMRLWGKLAFLSAGTALSSTFVLAAPAAAQVYEEAGNSGLDVIIVTAQKRAQDVQDVPIAVTALDGSMLEANRVTSVADLSGLAPGVTVRETAGGSNLASFSMRGAVSYGVVPGSDKQVSMYLDGVYISSPNGSIFDLPDVERIEVLRGPQGTLFGRNATAGAVSIATRDPAGEPGVKAVATFGNQNHSRFQLSADLPQMGPLSAYFSFHREKRRGDIRNEGADVIWDRSASQLARAARVDKSVDWLGSKDSWGFFGALKFESGDFTTVYKYDYYKDEGTPEGTAPVALDVNAPLIGSFLNTLINSQPFDVTFTPDSRRPDALNNAWAVPLDQSVQGHSLTSTYQISDALAVKNIFAYRKSFIFSATSLDGISSLPLTGESIGPYATFVAFATGLLTGAEPPAVIQGTIGAIAQNLAPLVGQPFIAVATHVTPRSSQISDELQLNYDSDFLTATVGALWFHSKDSIAEMRFNNTIQFQPIPGGVLMNTNIGDMTNKQTSLAAYAQLEFHVTPELDIVLGGRITRDKKTSELVYGDNLDSLSTLVPPAYKKTKPTYLIGVNYKPSSDVLLYAKYSTAFVSGGSVAGVPFAPETATSWEAGAKAEFLDRKVRANLALFHATYKNYQTAQSATNYVDYITEVTGDPARAGILGTISIPLADKVKAKGFELEVTAAPLNGFTLGGALGYVKTTASNITQAIIDSNGGRYRIGQFRPKWNGSLWAQYETPPLFGDAYLQARADGIWQGEMALAANPDRAIYDNLPSRVTDLPAYWILNGRVALRNVDLGGVSTQIALWGKNLTDRRDPAFSLNLQFIEAANFIPARSYGVDVTVEF